MHSCIRQFISNQHGVIFPIVAFAMLGLIGAVGTAVDIGRGQLMQSKMQNALDAAGLAAAASVNTSDIQSEVTRYMNLNFATNLQGTTITSLVPTLSEDGTILTVHATATMPTSFMGIFGQNTMNLAATTEVTRSNKGMELVLVLDTTGSMAGSKLTALKTASHDLIEILYGEGNSTAENLWIGVVPFSQGVNIGASHTDWIDSAHYGTLDWHGVPWAGCVEARYTGRDITDDTPSLEALKAYYWPDTSNNDWLRNSTSESTSNTVRICNNQSSCRCGTTYVCGCTSSSTSSTEGALTTTVTTDICINCSGSGSSRRCNQTTTTTTAVTSPAPFPVITNEQGPNRYCPSEVTRLTSTRADVEAGIDALEARGATHIPTGAVWGWRMLSPRWRGLWGNPMDTNALPLDYNTDLMIKAAIIMTDGENTMYSNIDGAYGVLGDNQLGTTDAGAASDALDGKVTSICNAMKAQGIIVYTIVFDLNSTGVETMMRNCATQPDYFFDSPDAATLQQAFRTIGDSLANLRISQ